MAAETTDITGSNQPDILSYLTHILSDLHDILPKLHQIDDLTRVNRDSLAKLEAELDSWRPLLAQFRSPAATYMTSRRLRRNGASQDPA